ncbi:MAG: transposase [Methylococcales bacterium]|nr:transposase [Methylococcales bacterium]
MSKDADLSFTDEEVIAVYLFGCWTSTERSRGIYDYADRHLRPWFPRLPSYVAYVQRLNRAVNVFAPLLETIQQEHVPENSHQAWLIDSFPVALAEQGYRFKASVAEELADSGYCVTKKLYYYGVRVHVIGSRQLGTLPAPAYIGATGASAHDGKVLDQIRPCLHNQELYGDKDYQRPDAKAIRQAQNLTVLSRLKNKKGSAIWHPRINGCPQRFLVFGNRLKRYLPGLKKRPALSAPVHCVRIMGLCCIYSESWLRLCSSGIFTSQLLIHIQVMDAFDKLLLRKRSIIEIINDQLKNSYDLEHSRHRSLVNYLFHVGASLVAYSYQEKKQALNLRAADLLPFIMNA